MAGLKINKKVAKEVKIDDKDIKIKDNSSSGNSTESDSTDIDINFGELKSSIDEVEEGDDDESFEDVDENSTTAGTPVFVVFLYLVLVTG